MFPGSRVFQPLLLSTSGCQLVISKRKRINHWSGVGRGGEGSPQHEYASLILGFHLTNDLLHSFEIPEVGIPDISSTYQKYDDFKSDGGYCLSQAS